MKFFKQIRTRIRQTYRHLFGKKGKIYLISDLHLDHGNIIRYCQRPYRDVRHMNSDLIKKWNSVVKNEDKVYYLGDFALSRHPNRWKRKFNGRKVFICGNHDRGLTGTKEFERVDYKGHKFWLTHYPNQMPKDWDGWLIHGHTHNNSKKYPFINGDLRTINVSCELIGYRPLSLDYLISLDISSIKRMETIDSKPERCE